MGNVTSIVSDLDVNERVINEKSEAVQAFTRVRRLPRHLARRVRRHFRHYYGSKTGLDEQEVGCDSRGCSLPTTRHLSLVCFVGWVPHQILGAMSHQLRVEVALYLAKELFGRVAIFTYMQPYQWAKILPVLRPVLFSKAEDICVQGDLVTEMFIIIEGDFIASSNFEDEEGEIVTIKREMANGDVINMYAVTKVRPAIPCRLLSTPGKERACFVLPSRRRASVDRATLILLLTRVNRMTQIWSLAIENIKTDSHTAECYGLAADDLTALIPEDSGTFKEMQDTAAEHFFMVPEAESLYGRPVRPLSRKEMKQKKEKEEARPDFTDRRTRMLKASRRDSFSRSAHAQGI